MASKLTIKDKTENGQFLKISPFRKNIRKTDPHKHNNYFEIVYLSKGSGTHTIDHKSYPVRTPVIFFIRKEQVHHWELLTEPAGFVTILQKAFIDKSLDSELKRLLTEISNLQSLGVRDYKSVGRIFQLLVAANQAPNEYRFPLIEGLLKALLAKVLEGSVPLIHNNRKPVDMFQSYRELLTQSNDIRNNVSYYAELLSTTPQNLNIVCRKAVNQSASAVLAEYLIGEAKRLLFYTDNTVAEISYILHFNDPSHFIKYFKRFTNCTPQVFRKR
ncbi:MAG: helix-turn-helix domain-containing protein [Chitinophagaceae bacterium]|nr:MAG: helix-turn-helix domain-containing protein [Chitinophagaceae bacterium]